MKKRLLSSSPKLFTQEEANQTLPLVSAILADLEPLWKAVQGTRGRVEHLLENRDADRKNPYADELKAVEEKLMYDIAKVESLIDELRELGVEFKSTKRECHACFPTMLEGRLVYLSWQLGELDVSHWMDLDGDFEDRQSLLATAAD